MQALRYHLKISLGSVLFLLFAISCATPPPIRLDQRLSIPVLHPEIGKRSEKIIFFVIEPQKEVNGQETLIDAFSQVITRNFVSVHSMGTVQNKEMGLNSLAKRYQGEKIDYVVIVSDIKELVRGFEFKYTLQSVEGTKVEEQQIIGYGGTLIAYISDSAIKLESAIQGFSIQTLEERLKAELMAKLKAKREMFLPYGFDVLDFVSYAKATLRVKGDINFGGAVPEIDFRTFKDKNCVEIKVNYLVTYNTLKVSMYEAASMTFDEIVKKLAKKISTDFKKQDEISGFIFNVTYTNKDFSEKYDTPRYVTNEFVLPKEGYRQYAAFDITNQDLVNQSIVLVDGERISLNLQISK